MALPQGTRLGPYEILGPIGAGGMGRVFRARDVKLDRPVAIKVLRRQKDDPVKAAQALERLGQMFIKRGMPREAVYYYKQLGRDFPKVKVRDDKTGADLLEEIATDKRFLPYFE